MANSYHIFEIHTGFLPQCKIRINIFKLCDIFVISICIFRKNQHWSFWQICFVSLKIVCRSEQWSSHNIFNQNKCHHIDNDDDDDDDYDDEDDDDDDDDEYGSLWIQNSSCLRFLLGEVFYLKA